MHKNSNTILGVFSVDTDVFILLTGHVSSLPKSTSLLRKTKKRICIHECYFKLGPNKAAEALTRWYAFKGTDNTGACSGKGIINHYKPFLQSDMDILSTKASPPIFISHPILLGIIKWQTYTSVLRHSSSS